MGAPAIVAFAAERTQRIAQRVRLVGDHIDELERLRLAVRGDFFRLDVMERTAPLGVGEGFFLILGKVGEA